MPKGLLTVVGSLDISQFWPASKGTNSSDGDTVHLKVDPNNSFLITKAPGAKPKVTKAFVGAHVFDHGNKNVITSKSEIKIRLQGIDTPELHFPVIAKVDPSKKGKFSTEFRQPFGAGAAKALHDHLMTLVGTGGGTVIHASLVTQIDQPGQATDSHGRFIGDILVGTAGAKSINTWLVENGWAYPLFYDSMTVAEINTLVTAWKNGKTLAARPGKAYQRPLQPFDPTMNVNNAKVPDPGKLNFPKIFRRQATLWAGVPGPLPGTQFVALLGKGIKGKADTAFPLNYFLANINKLDPKKRVTLISQIGSQGQSNFDPPDLVFKEDVSRLLDAKGKPVTSWGV
jgi:endonuclease YncB( thermonuclease family)